MPSSTPGFAMSSRQLSAVSRQEDAIGGLSLPAGTLAAERQPVARRLLRPRTLTILLPMAALAFVVLFGETIAPYDVQKPDYTSRLAAPSADHWFGTDE